jgi:hypothetical protein
MVAVRYETRAKRDLADIISRNQFKAKLAARRAAQMARQGITGVISLADNISDKELLCGSVQDALRKTSTNVLLANAGGATDAAEKKPAVAPFKASRPSAVSTKASPSKLDYHF